MPLKGFIGIISVVCGLAASSAFGATFNLLGLGANLPTPLVLNVDGIRLTLDGGGGFNSSSTSFGIDKNTSGGYVDDPNLIDGFETLFLFFDQDVLLDSIVISEFDSQDSGDLVLKSILTIPLSNGLVDVGGIRLNANSSNYRVTSSIGILTGGTRGFSLDQISVRAVPEPVALCLAFVGLTVCMTCGRRLTRHCKSAKRIFVFAENQKPVFRLRLSHSPPRGYASASRIASTIPAVV